MTRRRAGTVTALAILAVLEGLVAEAYYVRGTSWHWLLHGTVGLGLGLAVGGVLAVLRRRPVRALPWALAGQAVSITPDVLFLAGRLPHRRWMDVFVGHIAIHTAPVPLLVGVAVFLLGGWSWFAGSALARRTTAAALAIAAGVVLGSALALARPLPESLSDFDDRGMAARWWCGDPPDPDAAG